MFSSFYQKLSVRGRWVFFSLVFIVLSLLIGVLVYFSNRHTLTITTDSVPLQLEIGDKKYTIKAKETTLTLDKGFYHYRVSSQSHFAVLTDTIDLTETNHQTLAIKYDIYSLNSISKVACTFYEAYCEVSPKDLRTSYFEDYSWAIVRATPDPEGGLVLRLNKQNSWDLAGYIGETGETTGEYPYSVEKEVYR